jgi:hypothetical protein
MNEEALAGFDHDGIREYLRSVLWQYRLMDAFWFLNVEKRFGLAAAEELNASVWGKLGELGARDIVKRFGPFPPGVDGFLAAYKLFPWSLMVDYDIERQGDEAVVTVARCPAQMGRLKHGLGEYACRDMHHGEFAGFAKVIDPNLAVECLFAPPGPHPEDLHCRWRFSRVLP